MFSLYFKYTAIILFTFVFVNTKCIGQIFYSNGTTIEINNVPVYINGGATIDNGGTIINDGTIYTRNSSIAGFYELKNNANGSGNGIYYIQNNWINSALFAANNSEVFLDGINQNIQGTSVTQFHKLTLLNGGVKKLFNHAAVDNSGILSLNNSELATENYNFIVYNSDILSLTKGPSGFVSSLANGKLYRVTNQVTPYLYPTGSALNGTFVYRPVEITPTTTTISTYGVRFAKNNATNDNYDLSQKDDSICTLNTAYYHRINRLTGSAVATYAINYDPINDGDWSGTAQWQLPQGGKWNSTGLGQKGSGLVGLSEMKKNNWNTFVDSSVSAGDQFVLARVRAPSPVIKAPLLSCANFLPIQFSAHGVDSTNVFSWTFPVGVTFTVQGNDTVNSSWYNVLTGNVIVTEDILGCSSVPDTVQVKMNPLPALAFDNNLPCEDTATAFINKSTIVSGTIDNYRWNFGNSISSNAKDTVINYNQAGTYLVKLIGTSNLGCVDSIIKSVTIYPHPTVAFSVDTAFVCARSCLPFTETTTVGGNSYISDLYWNFGDGTDSVNQNGTVWHCYQNDGLYTVSLTAISDKGCRNSLVKNNQIKVYPTANASFTVNPSKEISTNYPTVTLENKSLNQANTDYTWNLGDSSDLIKQFSLQNLTYTYQDTGYFMVSLIANNTFNCRDTMIEIVHVKPSFTLYIPNAFTPNGDRKNDQFNIKGVGIKDFEMVIYNRWGEIVYKVTDLNKGWDGSSYIDPSNICQSDVYVWRLTLTDYEDKTHNRSGEVVLLQ